MENGYSAIKQFKIGLCISTQKIVIYYTQFSVSSDFVTNISCFEASAMLLQPIDDRTLLKFESNVLPIGSHNVFLYTNCLPILGLNLQLIIIIM